MTDGFQQDLIDLRGAELEGLVFNVQITNDSGHVYDLRDYRVVIFDELPDVQDGPLNTLVYSRTDGKIRVVTKFFDTWEWTTITIFQV